MTGDAIHAAGGGIVDGAAKDVVAIAFGGSDAAGAISGGAITGIGHFEGAENVIGGEIVEVFPRGELHDVAEEDVIDITVAEAEAGIVGGNFGASEGDGFVITGPVWVARKAGAEARGVSEEVPNGDGRFVVGGEIGNEFGDGIVEIESAAFGEDHDGRCSGDDFGERGGIEDGVFGHRFAFWKNGTVAIGAMVRSPFAFEPENTAGEFVAGNILGDDDVDFGEFFGMKAICGGWGGCGARGVAFPGILRKEKGAREEDGARDRKQNSCRSHYRGIVRREGTLPQE